MPALHLRPFRNKGDVKRMMQRLFGTASRDLEIFDPLTMAAFLSHGTRFPGAFDVIRSPGGESSWPFDWYLYPADSMFQPILAGNAVLEERFWNPGQGLLPSTAGFFAHGVMLGWYFRPSVLTISYYTSGDVRQTGNTAQLYAMTTHNPDVGLPNSGDVLGKATLGRAIDLTVQEIQIFSLTPVLGASPHAVHALQPLPLIPGQRIMLDEIIGLDPTDRLRVTMVGEWVFDPRLMPAEEEPNR